MFTNTKLYSKSMFGNTVISIFFAFAKVNFAVFSLFKKRMPLVGRISAQQNSRKRRFVPTGTKPCITRYKRTKSSQCRDRPASRQGRDTKRINPPKESVMALRSFFGLSARSAYTSGNKIPLLHSIWKKILTANLITNPENDYVSDC